MKISNYKKEDWKKYSGYAVVFAGLLSILLLFTACPGTTPKKKPNGYGLYDMTGNVVEWCWDWYGDDTTVYSKQDPTGKDTGTKRVTRGGGWYQASNNATRMIRFADPPNNKDKNIGFRIACRISN